jgi:hypothetical protein
MERNLSQRHTNKKKLDIQTERETLGQLIKRRMFDLRISTSAQLARQLGYSRSYVTHLVNDSSSSKRDITCRNPGWSSD